jgi:hypothetical protein
VFQDGSDDLPVFNEGQDAHDSPTLWTGQGVHFIDLLDEPRPVLPVFLGAFIGFQDAGDPVAFGFFPFPPGDVTVVPIIPDDLFPPVWDVGTHDGQPLQRIEDLLLGSVFRPVDNLGRFSEIIL